MTVFAMSRSELSRYETLQRVERGEITTSEAGDLLRLCRRQVYRLLDRFRVHGAAGLISRKRGRPSNRRLSETYREQILDIVRERYADFGPTLAAEYLAERHGITLSHETLRQLMIGAGLWKAKAARSSSAIGLPKLSSQTARFKPKFGRTSDKMLRNHVIA